MAASCALPASGNSAASYVNEAQDAYPSTASHPRAAVYQAFLDELISRGIVGISMSLRGEHGRWPGAAGWADREAGAPLEANTISCICSVSKTYTSVVILRLVQAGN